MPKQWSVDMQFEWHRPKAKANLSKHGVGFEDATTVFGDPLALTFDDPDHSGEEKRYLLFGISVSGKLLVVSHTPRGTNTRIISARRMTAAERDMYEHD